MSPSVLPPLFLLRFRYATDQTPSSEHTVETASAPSGLSGASSLLSVPPVDQTLVAFAGVADT